MMRPPAAYFLVSAAAHAAVFASLSGPGNVIQPPPPRPLEVRLVLAAEARPVLPAALLAPPVRREVRPILLAAQNPIPRPATQVVPKPPPPAAPAQAADPLSPRDQPAPPSDIPVASAPATTAAPVTERIALQRPVVPVAVTDASRYPDPALVAGYARTLSDGVARMRRYPALARMRGWQGTAVVNVTVGPNGEILDLKVSRSSGHEVLDLQAMTMIREAQPLPPAPEALRGLALVVQLPVTFALTP